MNSLIPARFGLRAKLLSGAAVLLAFTAVIGVLGIASARTRPTPAPTKMYGSSVEPLAELGTAAPSSTRTAPSPNNHILETEAAGEGELESKIEANNAVVDKNLAAVEKFIGHGRGKARCSPRCAAT